MKLKAIALIIPLCFGLDVKAEPIQPELTQPGLTQTELLISRIESSANKLNLAPDIYLKAAHKYERLIDENDENNDFYIKKIESFPEYVEALSYAQAGMELPSELENTMNRLYNMQQQALASGLGIDVSILKPFLNEVSKGFVKSKLAKNKSDIYSTSKKGDREIVRVQCSDDNCGRGDWGSNSFSLSIYVHNSALDAGINQGEPFVLEFTDKNTEEIIKQEKWRYNNFTGAWKEGTYPCPDCQVDY